ncbi:restriction endonuclease subunit S [Campylobacter volucris]|uniref:restriction endonuclease subunit S n=1 Tax=Campylobacter volucris TaxID=1031542 RepID=UPI001E56B18B|nr:restriction endonuclease subunit S [Campylobacter volucris]
MFEIDNTASFNQDKLKVGDEYDYITRTSFNQGILGQTGFINKENLNPSGIWSLGLLQMTFFYRKREWYAGQFVRKVKPKINIPSNAINFITTILNMQSKILLNVLVRNIDETFKNLTVKLPTKNKEIDFEFMEEFICDMNTRYIAELDIRHTIELEAYLTATGLKSYKLTSEEEYILNNYSKIQWKEIDIVNIFQIKNTQNILSSLIKSNSGNTPYLCASAENNGVSTYINYNKNFLDKGNCIFIGGKTFVISYQKDDFYSNDSHNLALYLKNNVSTKNNSLYLATCIRSSLKYKYSWGNSISKTKIYKDKILVPIKNGKIDFEFMENFISAIEKLVIKDIVKYAKKNKEIINQIIKNSQK